jgi:hypothetical protein
MKSNLGIAGIGALALVLLVPPAGAYAAGPDRVSFRNVSVTDMDGTVVEIQGSGVDRTPGTGLDAGGVIRVEITSPDGTVYRETFPVQCVNAVGDRAVVIAANPSGTVRPRIAGYAFYVEDVGDAQDRLLMVPLRVVSESNIGQLCDPLAPAPQQVNGEIDVTDGDE